MADETPQGVPFDTVLPARPELGRERATQNVFVNSANGNQFHVSTSQIGEGLIIKNGGKEVRMRDDKLFATDRDGELVEVAARADDIRAIGAAIRAAAGNGVLEHVERKEISDLTSQAFSNARDDIERGGR